MDQRCIIKTRRIDETDSPIFAKSRSCFLANSFRQFDRCLFFCCCWYVQVKEKVELVFALALFFSLSFKFVNIDDLRSNVSHSITDTVIPDDSVSDFHLCRHKTRSNGYKKSGKSLRLFLIGKCFGQRMWRKQFLIWFSKKKLLLFTF